MRIISQFRDYYDSCQAYGQDENFVYKRDTAENSLFTVEQAYFDKIRPLTSLPEFCSNKYQNLVSSRLLNWSYGVIGFCGKLYFVLLAHDILDQNNRVEYIYDYNEFSQFYSDLKSRNYKGYSKAFDQFEKRRKGKFAFYVRKPEVEEGFRSLLQGVEDDDIFHELKAPVFYTSLRRRWSWHYGQVSSQCSFIINPNLSDLQFYKLIDPFTAYQEIHMYLSGVIGVGQPETIEIGDLEMKKKKGFGHKYAFKKEPETK